MTIAALLLTGMGVALLGTIKLPLARRLEIDEARVGGMISAFGFALIPVIPTAGFVTDLVGKQTVVMAGSVLMAISLGLLGRARTYPIAFLSVLLFSAAWSSLVNVINVLTPLAFPGGTTFATNLGNVVFGVGAFVTPLAAGLVLRRTGLSVALGVLACLAALPAVLALGVDFPVASATSGPSASVEAGADAGFATLIGDRAMWLFAFVLFFYGPLEASMAGWATTYLRDQGVSETRASSLLSVFWLIFMMARLVTALTARLIAGHEAVFVFVLALASTLVLSVLYMGRGRAVAVGVVCAAGVSFGPVFPTLMAMLLNHFPPTLHGRAVGLLFGIGGVGWTTIPMLMGAYARRSSVQRAFAIAIASALGLCVVTAVLAL